ncbi:MAG TPA: hypothetical protein P5560_02860 [Thermotogota bacterium]|nr:hypothetical protein [Thermotogota bacterium]HRW91871.1 hypothetical protein [Thermotogota bacterium]
MKKPLFLFFLFLLILSGFSLANPFEESTEVFIQLVDEYRKGEGPVIHELELMSLYRKYRLAFMGGVQNEEKFFDVDKLLEAVFEKYQKGDFTYDLAFAAFLGYVSSGLFNVSFDVMRLNQFPPFYKTFHSFGETIRNEAIGFFSLWIGYGIGLVEEKPEGDFPIEAPVQRLRIRYRLSFTPDPDVFPLLLDSITPEVRERLLEAVKRVQREISSSTTPETLQTLIRRNALYAAFPITESMTNEQENTAKLFSRAAESLGSLFWIRFPLFLVLLAFTWFFKRPWFSKLLGLVFLFEVVALLFSRGLFLSPVDSTLYGLLSWSLFGFAILLFLGRLFNPKIRSRIEVAHLFLLLFVLSLFLLPVFHSPKALLMDENPDFYGSPFYSFLQEELFGWEKAYLVDPLNHLNRQGKLQESSVVALEKRFQKVLGFSGQTLRQDIQAFLPAMLARPVVSANSALNIPARLENVVQQALSEPPSAPNVRFFQTQKGGWLSFVAMVGVSCIVILRLRAKTLLLCFLGLALVPILFLPWGTFYIFVEEGFDFIRVGSLPPFWLFLLFAYAFLALSFFFSSSILPSKLSKEV